MITIENIPDDLVSFYDDVIYEVSSNATADELKFKAELLVRLVGEPTYESLSIDYVIADANGEYYYNVSDKLSTYIHETFNVGTNGQLHTLPHVVEFKANFTELYFDADGFFEEYDSDESTSSIAVGTIIQHTDISELSDFVMGSDSQRFLTEHPIRNLVKNNQPIVLVWYQDESDNFTPVINIINPPSPGGNIAFSSGFSIGFR